MYAEILAKCEHCGHWSPEFAFCGECGAPVGEGVYAPGDEARAFTSCEYCNAPNVVMSKCRGCGAPVDPPDYIHWDNNEYWIDGGGIPAPSPYSDWNGTPYWTDGGSSSNIPAPSAYGEWNAPSPFSEWEGSSDCEKDLRKINNNQPYIDHLESIKDFVPWAKKKLDQLRGR